MPDTFTDPYSPTRPIMTAAELLTHHLTAFGRDYTVSCDGWDDMEANGAKGWRSVSAWGRDGWDLADWPYVVISHGTLKADGPGKYRLLSVCEGDHTVYTFDTPADRDAATDYLFIWYGVGRSYDEWVAEGLTDDKRAALDAGALRVPVRFRGPFSWARMDGTPVPDANTAA